MNRTHRTKFVPGALLGAMIVLTGAAAMAQSTPPATAPGSDRPVAQERERRVLAEQGQRRVERREAPSPEQMRERLERRRAELNAEQARIDNAIQMLDKGATPQEVWEALRPPMPEKREGVEGERGEMRRPGPAPGIGPGRGHGDGPHPHGQMRGPRGPGAHGEGMPPEVRERMERVIRERNPEAHRRMMELRERRPEAADRLLDNLAPRMQELSELSERDPALFELRVEALRLDFATMDAAGAYLRLQGAGAPEQEQAEAMARLRSVVSERVELGMRERAHQIQAMARRLETLQGEVGADDARRTEMIDRATREVIERARRHAAQDQRRREQE